MTAGERAARPLLGWSDQPDLDAAGQFAWADPDRITRILTAAGWRGVEIIPLDVPCTMAGSDLAAYAHRMGPVGTVLPDLNTLLVIKLKRR
jgi:hypothetical protein